jgi:SAM-dependent methyltransferase
MAFYNSYNYQQYWQGREYEHESEKIALEELFKKIPQKSQKSILEIGAGFGRLALIYTPKFSRCLLIEPSRKLINQAKQNLAKQKNITIKEGKAESLKIKSKFDVVLLVRVAHHLEDLAPTFKNINHSLKEDGYLILEFANKINFKSKLKMWLRGNFAFSQDLKACDRRSAANINKETIPFLNHHPRKISQDLFEAGFKTIDRLSVSNFRWPLLKKLIPAKILLRGEKALQSPLAKINFGPSIFVLAKKTNQLTKNN